MKPTRRDALNVGQSSDYGWNVPVCVVAQSQLTLSVVAPRPDITEVVNRQSMLASGCNIRERCSHRGYLLGLQQTQVVTVTKRSKRVVAPGPDPPCIVQSQ